MIFHRDFRSFSIVLSIISIAFIGYTMAEDCNESESMLLCHGARVVRNVVKSLHDSNAPLTIIPGLEIVNVPEYEQKQREFDGRSNEIEDDSFTGRISNYMHNHELKIKFSDLLEKTDFKDALLTTLKSIDDGKEVVEGRKKDKGGMGAVMLMGLMMGKMMAALGLGGVGALAMKALGVSMLALLLSAIVGIKKLSESGHDDGGHHVQYISAEGHHRRRREIINDEIPLPYRGWTHLAPK